MVYGAGTAVGLGLGSAIVMGGRRPEAGFDVHGDARAGDDAADGLTPATAKRTIAAVRALAAAMIAARGAGVRVGLARGSLWDEELSLGGAGTVVGSYGDPALPLPVLRGSDWVPNDAFAPVPGRAQVHGVAWAHALATNGKAQIFVWQDGVRLVWVADAAACDATPGSFTYPEPLTAAPAAVMVHPIGSVAPASGGATFRIVRRNYAVRLNGQGAAIEGVHGAQCGHDDGALKIGERVTGGRMRWALATWGTKHAAFVWAREAAVEDCAAYVCRNRAGQPLTTFVAYHDDADAAGGVTFRNCWAHAPEGAAPDFATDDTAFYAHTNGGTATIGAGRVEGCHVRGSARAFTMADHASLTIEDSSAEDCGTFSGGGAVSIDNVVCVSARANAAFLGAGPGARSVREAKVLLESGAADLGRDGGPSGALAITDSTLVVGRRLIEAAAGSVVVTGSVLAASVVYDRPMGKTVAAGDNTIWRRGADLTLRIDGVDYPGLAALQAGVPGLEAGSDEVGEAGLDPAAMRANDWTGSTGRGSAATVRARPWGYLRARWKAGFLGIDEIDGAGGAGAAGRHRGDAGRLGRDPADRGRRDRGRISDRGGVMAGFYKLKSDANGSWTRVEGALPIAVGGLVPGAAYEVVAASDLVREVVAGGPLAAPVNLAPPSVEGVAEIGESLVAVAGSWAGNPPPTITRQWRRDGEDIAGATGPVQFVGAAGDYVLREIAQNLEGTAFADSPAIEVTASGISQIGALWAGGRAGALYDFTEVGGPLALRGRAQPRAGRQQPEHPLRARRQGGARGGARAARPEPRGLRGGVRVLGRQRRRHLVARRGGGRDLPGGVRDARRQRLVRAQGRRRGAGDLQQPAVLHRQRQPEQQSREPRAPGDAGRPAGERQRAGGHPQPWAPRCPGASCGSRACRCGGPRGRASPGSPGGARRAGWPPGRITWCRPAPWRCARGCRTGFTPWGTRRRRVRRSRAGSWSPGDRGLRSRRRARPARSSRGCRARRRRGSSRRG
jgi:hypothetical protein